MIVLLDIICILLILLTPLSFLPLYKALFVARLTNGISVAATLFLALCAQSQIATLYYLWACPPFKRDGNVVPKPPQLIDYLNMVQLLLQWICSLVLLAFDIVVRARASTIVQGDPTVIKINRDAHPSNKTAITLLILHASLCVFWAILAGKPRDDWLDLPFVTIVGINQYCINPLITVATAAAFVIQESVVGRSQGPSALNRTTLLPQAALFLVLAVSWPFRFKVPQNLRYPGWVLEEWYPLVGWVCVNNAIIAIGQGILLYADSGRGDRKVEQNGERRLLLAT